MCGLGSLLALIFGLIALRQIRERNEEGKGLAIAGSILGAIGVLVFVGWLALVAVAGTSTDSSSGSSYGFPSDFGSDDLSACKTDTKTLKTAIVAWNTQFLSGDPEMTRSGYYDTAYPLSMDDLLSSNTKMLSERSEYHDLELQGGGANPPLIVKLPGRCDSEVIEQLN